MRKKILIGGIVIIALSVWFLWFLGGRIIENKNTVEVPQKITQVDTDNDGLPDWEEALWQTDNKNPDTDGDGTPDGAEVLASRDPKKAGPGDTLTNPADRFQILARNAVVDKSAPVLIPPPEAIADRQADPLGKLTILDKETPETIKLYGSTFAEAIKPYSASNNANMSQVMMHFVETGDSKDLTVLAQASAGIGETLKKLKGVAIPKSVSASHRSFVEHLAKLGELIGNMSQIAAEPVMAAQSAQQYILEDIYTTKALLEINQYFIDHKLKLQ